MKRGMLWMVCCIGWMAVSHAQTVRKTAPARGVDLEAAARATAALYAAMSSPTAASTAAPAPWPATAAAPEPARPAPPQVLTLLPVAPVQAEPAQVPATEVWAGAYQCERAEKVQLRPDAEADQVELQWKGQRWKMRQMVTRSGALRLEDAHARMVWIQLANKSMLLDQHQGKRLLDECQHHEQVQTAARMKTNPPPALFDTTGMGR